MGDSNFVISVRNVRRAGKPNARFGSEPGPALYLEVPDAERVPHPTRHDMDRMEWIERLIKRATKNRHSKNLKSAVAGYTYGDILIFIHGYNNSMEAVMHRHNLLQEQLREQGYEGAIVSFDWPSADATLNYLEDRSDARKTAEFLVKDGIAVLAQAQLKQDENKCDIDVHLLGHSTGAYVIREAFYESNQNRSLSRVNWQVSQIALIGADIARKSLSKDDGKSQALFRHATRITNYQNPNDSALKISNVKRLGMAARAGRVGLPDDAPENIVNVNVGEHWETLKQEDSRASGNWSHSWHFDDPLFAEDLVFTLSGDIDRHAIPTRSLRQGELYLTPKKK